MKKLKRVWNKYQRKDPLKYDSFLRIIKGKFEALSGYQYIKAKDIDVKQMERNDNSSEEDDA